MADKGLVLVTGAAGFIGSHLVERLLREGNRVRAFVRYTSTGSKGYLEDLPQHLLEGCEIFLGDINDARAVQEAMKGCARVFHLAALIGIPYSYVAPGSYVASNIMGTFNVLEAARSHRVDRVVVTSTSEVYGTALFTPITEDHPLQPQSPYSASKIGADNLALSYYRSFDLPVAIVRPFNTYGPRQSARAVIPTIILQALYGDVVQIGSRDPIRDMVFVADTVAGFLAVAESPACVGETTNLATGIGVSVGGLIELILKFVGRKVEIRETSDRKRPPKSEVFQLLGSAARAKERTGWSSAVSLEEGLAQTIHWFSERGRADNISAYRI